VPPIAQRHDDARIDADQGESIIPAHETASFMRDSYERPRNRRASAALIPLSNNGAERPAYRFFGGGGFFFGGNVAVYSMASRTQASIRVSSARTSSGNAT
jgi:hypothetical protein